MPRANISIRAIALAVLLAGSAVIFSGCPPATGSPAGKASLSITMILPNSARTILPPLDMTPVGYSIAATGPAGQRVEKATSSAAVLFENLDVGDWVLTATALNQAGTAIGEGTQTARLATDQTTVVEIRMGPLAGTGTLQLTARWPVEAVPAPSLVSSLTAPTGDVIPLSFSMDAGAATSSKGDLPSGYYTLQLQLFTDGLLAAGASDIVRILKDQTSSGTIEFTDLERGTGSLQVAITPELDNPLVLEIAGRQSAMGLGGSITLKPWLDVEPVGLACRWYVDGVPRSADRVATLGADLSAGSHRIDLAAFSADGGGAGSSGFPIKVRSQFPRGSLALSGLLRDGTGGMDGLNGCRSVCLSPDGSSLYAAGYGDNSVAWFQRDADTGALRYRGHFRNGAQGIQGLAGAESLAISPDGRYLFAAGWTDNAIVTFTRDTVSGALTYLGCMKNGDPGVDGLAGPKDVAASPDGKNLYCAGYTSGAVTVFTLDPSTGALAQIQALRDGEGSLTLLGGPSGIGISPDGAQVLVAAYLDDSLLVFQRDQSSGALSLAQCFTDGLAGCDGLNGADGVDISPDGGSVYSAGYYDNAVSVYSRDLSTGMLTFSAVFKDGVAGVEGLRYARSVAVSPDGLSVYASGSADDGVAVFVRSPATGGLTYSSWIDGLGGARGLGISPDGRNCYAACAEANALAVLNRSWR